MNLPFFFNYYWAILGINYWLLPRYFYQKKYWRFSLFVALLLAVVILIEERVLEFWFYPDTRAKGFPGVVFTLTQISPIFLMFVGLKFGWDAFRKQNEVERLKHLVKESELQFLKSQINPHFLFNNLNNLYAYVLEKSEKAPELILKLSALLRYMLYDCKAEKVALEKELTFLENFIELQQLQIEHRGIIRYHKHGNTSGLAIAPLILIVFIENCFKHSTSSQTNNIEIDIQLKIHDHLITLECTNNYSPVNNAADLASGIGLENVTSRLELLYPNLFQLETRQTENQYHVTLQMELDNFAK